MRILCLPRWCRVGALAYEFDGVFIGATWTRDMRNMMLLSLAVYLASFALLRPSAIQGFGLPCSCFSLFEA
jgi:MATE family multidrug resistance protein